MINNITLLQAFFNFLYHGTLIKDKLYTIVNNLDFYKYLKYCKLLSYDNILKLKTGTCLDTVLLSKYYLDKWKIPYKIFFSSIVENYDGINGIKDDKTHIFLLYKDKNIWKWLEGSAKKFKCNSLMFKDPYILAFKILQYIKDNEMTTCYLREVFNYPNEYTSYKEFYKTLFKLKIITVIN